ncbi:MAG TPA: carboxymuconolactone decarboxylase family protein [Chthonomonadaceae bacterium]|nr:carboxymuconolactone decarboxylase family protein [Chthonomonadaceae bacterium]
MQTGKHTHRVAFSEVNPKVYPAMKEWGSYLEQSSIEASLRELIKVRASQINGCAFCLELHTRLAREQGETEYRLHLLNAWRETSYYTEAERAALELTEAVTLISHQGVPDELYARVRQHFTAEQYVDLLMVINIINAWNRLMISMGHMPPRHPTSDK